MNDAPGYKPLLYAVRFSVLGHIGSKLALVTAMLGLPPLLVALAFGEYDYIAAGAPAILVLLGAAWAGRLLQRPHHLLRSEGYTITCASFILTPLLMSFGLAPSELPFADRLFESVSAITTTGLSTVADVETMGHTFLFTRAWMQWYGGLGIVVLSVTLLMSRSLATHQLLELPEGPDMVQAAIVFAQRLLKVYVILTALVIAICWISVGDFFTAVLLGLSAISTGGFAPLSDSLAALPFVAQAAVMSGGVAGAIALPVYLHLQRGSWRQVIDNGELRVFLLLLVILCSLVSLSVSGQYDDLFSAVKVGVIMGLSALSTTGFANVEVATLSDSVKLLLIAAMFIGGCLGSTAGGFKIYRLQVLGQSLLTTLRRASAAPHAVIEPRLNGRPVTNDQVQLAMLIGSLLVACSLCSWLVFLYYGYPPMDALFEVVSAVGTVGLSSGVVDADMPLALKMVLCVDMIAGRVEVIALVCLFYPGLWTGKRNPEL